MGRDGTGVSMTKLATGAWRVRWRDPNGKQREKTAPDEEAAIGLRAEVLRAVKAGQEWAAAPVEPPPRPTAPVLPAQVATVDAVFEGYLAAQENRVGASTMRTYFHRTELAKKTWRKLLGLAEDVEVPGSELNRGKVVSLFNALRAECSESTVYNVAILVLAAWGYATDCPEEFPGIAPSPRDPKSILPRAPVYAAAAAPTVAEIDAVLRQLAIPRTGGTHSALPTAVIMRWTGLRISQVLGLEVRDFNAAARTLFVRVGKSRREKAQPKTLPITDELVSFLQRLPSVCDGDPAASLVQRKANLKAKNRSRGSPRTFADAWEAAEKLGQVRPEVWRPETRENQRPEHAFRAAFQAALEAAGVREEIIDAFVGHAGSLRSRHYVDAGSRAAAMRAAVETLPPVDWKGPPKREAPGNLVDLDRERAARG